MKLFYRSSSYGGKSNCESEESGSRHKKCANQASYEKDSHKDYVFFSVPNYFDVG